MRRESLLAILNTPARRCGEAEFKSGSDASLTSAVNLALMSDDSDDASWPYSKRRRLTDNPGIGTGGFLFVRIARRWLFLQLIKRGWSADAPLEQLPDVRLLPSTVQAKVFFLCDMTTQKTLSATSSCFRPLWHECRPCGDSSNRKRSACEAWHELQLENISAKLSDLCMRAQVVKKAIHRAPAAHGSTTLHCCVQGHFDRHQLAYILQLPPGPLLQCLGFKIGCRILKYVDWPDYDFEQDDMGRSMFMSLHLSCRRQAGLSDAELEHLENLFCRLPESLSKLAEEYEEHGTDMVHLACEPRWRCSTCPPSYFAMQWHVPSGDIMFTAEASDLIV